MSEEAAVRPNAKTKVEQNRVPSFTIISYSIQILQILQMVASHDELSIEPWRD
jgi:hypothetical protein